MTQTPIPKEQSASGSVDQNVKPKHPGFGFMKGLLTVAPGTDLTAPSCPHWDAYPDKKYGPYSELGQLLAQVAGRE